MTVELFAEYFSNSMILGVRLLAHTMMMMMVVVVVVMVVVVMMILGTYLQFQSQQLEQH